MLVPTLKDRVGKEKKDREEEKWGEKEKYKEI